jgi:protein O-GlcNAc transferase
MTKVSATISVDDAFTQCQKLLGEQRFSECLNLANSILQEAPEHTNAKYTSAICYKELGNYAVAESLFLECLALYPNSIDCNFHLAYLYNIAGNTIKSSVYYEKVLAIDPGHLSAMNNLANLYNDAGKNDIALNLFNRMISLGCNQAFVYNNISLIYRKAGMLTEAANYICKAIELDPNSYIQYKNAAILFMAQANNKQYVWCLERALELKPDDIELNFEYCDALQKICDWEKHGIIQNKLAELRKIHGDTYIIPPMRDIQQRIDPAGNLAIAKRYTENMVRHAISIYPRYQFDESRRKPKEKLRIAYISSDIKDHPVAHLMRGVFKNHNKNEFEVYLYSSSGEDLSGYKDEIKTYCDKFIDISTTANHEISKIIYNDNIDILIDLNGHTGQSKLDVLALKPAPIQVNYLGYIGSMGADFIDYIITDEIVTPPDQQEFYTEKFAYLPDCYQANDSNLKISDENITRQMEGLPENAFVFCSFNQAIKIEPVMFDVWMNILKRVPDSVLWLFKGSIFFSDNMAAENLRKQAAMRCVDPKRLILSEGVFIDKHLKRKSLANLALDTRIYNGGTVTSQTLWAGTPVLTLQGGHFASRMASSILNAVGLPELITTTLEDYENLAVELAMNPEKLTAIKNKLSSNLTTYPLFKIERFVGNLEKAYKLMWENYAAGNEVKMLRVANS